jgi:hypothetical protein
MHADLWRPSGGGGRECHFPPGTSKRNKVEYRLFAHISVNWRGVELRIAGINRRGEGNETVVLH